MATGPSIRAALARLRIAALPSRALEPERPIFSRTRRRFQLTRLTHELIQSKPPPLAELLASRTPLGMSFSDRLSRLRISLPVLKYGSAFAGTNTAAPDRGLRPLRALYRFVENAPKPRSSTRSP